CSHFVSGVHWRILCKGYFHDLSIDQRANARSNLLARNTIWWLTGFDIEMVFPTIRRRPEVRHPANTIEDMKKLLLGYRDNMRVEIESDVPVTAKTVADLRALPTWPDGLVLDIHVDLDPRLSVVRVERAF